MDRTTLGFIRHLSKNDSKDLAEKALKVAEEAGELAKVVLPYRNAAGTRHRLIGRERILEEVVDTFLSAISVAYDLDFSDDEIEAMVHRKTAKWADIQAAEAGARFPLPFEVHVTVREAELEAFRAACASLGVKPIVLDLHTREGGVVKDVMTSSVFIGDNQGALAETRRISDGMKAAGFEVVREKIETVPSHPAAPSRRRAGAEMPVGCYFEAHLQVVCTDDRRDLLRIIAEGCGAHLSRNTFKALDAGAYVIMVTHRAYQGTIEDFRSEMDRATGLLRGAAYEIGKEIVEFAIMDTRVGHDASWTGA